MSLSGEPVSGPIFLPSFSLNDSSPHFLSNPNIVAPSSIVEEQPENNYVAKVVAETVVRSFKKNQKVQVMNDGFVGSPPGFGRCFQVLVPNLYPRTSVLTNPNCIYACQ